VYQPKGHRHVPLDHARSINRHTFRVQHDFERFAIQCRRRLTGQVSKRPHAANHVALQERGQGFTICEQSLHVGRIQPGKGSIIGSEQRDRQVARHALEQFLLQYRPSELLQLLVRERQLRHVRRALWSRRL